VFGELRPLLTRIVDDKSDPLMVENITRAFVEPGSGVDSLLAPFTSTLTHIASPIVDASEKLMIAGSAGDPRVYNGRNTFGVVPDFGMTLRTALRVLQGQGVRSAFVVVESEDTFSSEACSTGLVPFMRNDAERGLQVVGNSSISKVLVNPSEEGVREVGAIVGHVAAVDPDVLVMCTAYEACVALLHALRDRRVHVRNILALFCAGDGRFKADFTTGDSWHTGRYVLSPSPFNLLVSRGGSSPAVAGGECDNCFSPQAFRDSYVERFESEPATASAVTFAACEVLYWALEAANTTSSGELRRVLQTRSFATVLGPVRFSVQGQNDAPPPLVQYDANDVLQVVSPDSMATAPLLINMPSWHTRECEEAALCGAHGKCSALERLFCECEAGWTGRNCSSNWAIPVLAAGSLLGVAVLAVAVLAWRRQRAAVAYSASVEARSERIATIEEASLETFNRTIAFTLHELANPMTTMQTVLELLSAGHAAAAGGSKGSGGGSEKEGGSSDGGAAGHGECALGKGLLKSDPQGGGHAASDKAGRKGLLEVMEGALGHMQELMTDMRMGQMQLHVEDLPVVFAPTEWMSVLRDARHHVSNIYHCIVHFSVEASGVPDRVWMDAARTRQLVSDTLMHTVSLQRVAQSHAVPSDSTFPWSGHGEGGGALVVSCSVDIRWFHVEYVECCSPSGHGGHSWRSNRGGRSWRSNGSRHGAGPHGDRGVPRHWDDCDLTEEAVVLAGEEAHTSSSVPSAAVNLDYARMGRRMRLMEVQKGGGADSFRGGEVAVSVGGTGRKGKRGLSTSGFPFFVVHMEAHHTSVDACTALGASEVIQVAPISLLGLRSAGDVGPATTALPLHSGHTDPSGSMGVGAHPHVRAIPPLGISKGISVGSGVFPMQGNHHPPLHPPASGGRRKAHQHSQVVAATRESPSTERGAHNMEAQHPLPVVGFVSAPEVESAAGTPLPRYVASTRRMSCSSLDQAPRDESSGTGTSHVTLQELETGVGNALASFAVPLCDCCVLARRLGGILRVDGHSLAARASQAAANVGHSGTEEHSSTEMQPTTTVLCLPLLSVPSSVPSLTHGGLTDAAVEGATGPLRDGVLFHRVAAAPPQGSGLLVTGSVERDTPVHPVVSRVPRVLVCDDERVNCRLVSRILQHVGIACSTVHDGDEVMPELERAHAAGEDPYDVLLLDIVMRRQGGMTTCQQVLLSGFSLPIVAMTARASATNCAMYTCNGFQGTLAKPFTLDELYRAVENAMRGVRGVLQVGGQEYAALPGLVCDAP
jgi:CheY-like chemotaxis protein/ABC-type branched-subunit amino acid transport system substrate-binding protein